jgi:hypothetical protein
MPDRVRGVIPPPIAREGGGHGVRAAKEEPLHYARKTRVLLASLLVLGLPAGAAAQVSGNFSVDLHGGLAFPTGTFGDLTSTGFAYGGGLAFHFHPNVALRGDIMLITVDNGTNNEDPPLLLSPPVDLMYYGGGLEVNFNSPLYQDLPLTFGVNLEAGWTNFDVDETYSPSHPANGIDQGYLTFSFGGQVGYTAYRSGSMVLNLFVKGQPYLILTDSADMTPYSTNFGTEPIDHVWVIPVTGGVRLTF